jgi:putative flippase GtrA
MTVARTAAWRKVAGESVRYAAAAAFALAVDFSAYVMLIRVMAVNYLVAAPLGFSLGLAAIYVLSVRWVFGERRLRDARMEFLVFAFIGVAGMAVNQAVLYVAVEGAALSYELAKLAAAAVVFGFNFSLRKLLLFRA